LGQIERLFGLERGGEEREKREFGGFEEGLTSGPFLLPAGFI